MQIGQWEIHPTLNRISNATGEHALRPVTMQLLLCLAERPGEVFARNDLLETIWGDACVGEEGLTVAVSELRRALGDNSRTPQYIETIRKGGYRLIADVQHGPPASEIQFGTTASRASGRRLWSLIPLTIALVLVGLWSLGLLDNDDEAAVAVGNSSGVPLTSYRSSEIQPSFSPDGQRVAFAWAGPELENLDIWVITDNTTAPLQVTHSKAPDTTPVWSPDGNTLAFLRFGDQGGIYTIPATGGPEVQVLALKQTIHGLSWSPDGTLLAFATIWNDDPVVSIQLLSLVDHSIRPLFSEPSQTHHDLNPVFSPDGRQLAFKRTSGITEDLWLSDISSQTQRRLTLHMRQIGGATWTNDGQDLVYAAAQDAGFDLYRLSLADNRTRLLPVTGRQAVHPTISRDGRRLVFEEYEYNYDIWRIDLSHRDSVQLEPDPLISSTHSDQQASYSGDGRHLAFVSTRTGHTEIWLADQDGGNLRPLTALAGTYVWNPHCSPDGQSIAFNAVVDGLSVVYLGNVTTRQIRRLSDTDQHEIINGWSRDGQQIYISTNGHDTRQIQTRNRDTGQTALTVDHGLRALNETPDGNGLYYTRSDTTGLWRLDLANRQSVCIVDQQIARHWSGVAIASDGIYFSQATAKGMALGFLNFSTGSHQALATLPPYGCSNLALSPDETALLCDLTDSFECDLILVDDFE